MADTYNHRNARPKLVKLPDRYTGWLGEGCWRAHGRNFIKRLQRRALRRFNKVLTNKETNCHEDS